MIRIKVRSGDIPKGKGKIFIQKAPKANLMKKNRRNLALTPKEQISKILRTFV